ncbi:hypothetical protein [Paraburkholderia youngii]|uniref:hypothetical protein n=1 Tax=Paraburkholderia youngii TaxID=2782701 RepID=UPI003D1BF04D
MNHSNIATSAANQAAMDIRLVVVDETRFYSAEIQQKAGRVYQTYAYDASRGYHECDIRPSFELHPLNTTPLNYSDDRQERDALHELLFDANTHAQPRMWYCHDVRRIPSTHSKDYQIVALDDDDSYDVQFERVLDHLRGNVQLELPDNVY